jgi:hypothetical protein
VNARLRRTARFEGFARAISSTLLGRSADVREKKRLVSSPSPHHTYVVSVSPQAFRAASPLFIRRASSVRSASRFSRCSSSEGTALDGTAAALPTEVN